VWRVSAVELAERALLELSDELEHCFGFTHVRVDVRTGHDRTLVLVGSVLAPRTRDLVAARIQRVLPDGWSVDATGIVAHRTGDYRSIDDIVRLYRKLPGTADNALATELLPEDGPVEILAVEGGAALVRGMDVTLGWTADALGDSTATPAIAPSHGDIAALGNELDRWLGTPYALGGALRTGIDCSALVQRCFRSALGVLLPRHSSDQLAFAPRSEPGRPDSGDLLFVWSDQERPCHVGIVHHDTVVHASLSRRSVVRDPLSDFVGSARRVERVEWRALAASHAEFVGKPSIQLPARAPRDES
jgi:cell wall-associated NlpC family hydrolase